MHAISIYVLARCLSTNSVDDAVRGRGNDNIHISVSGCSILISFVMRSHINLFIVLSLVFAYLLPRGGCVCTAADNNATKAIAIEMKLYGECSPINKNRNINLCVFESMGGIVVHVSTHHHIPYLKSIVTRTEIDLMVMVVMKK